MKKKKKNYLIINEAMLRDGIGCKAAVMYSYLFKYSEGKKCKLPNEDIMAFFNFSRATFYRKLKTLSDFNYIKYSRGEEHILCLKDMDK